MSPREWKFQIADMLAAIGKIQGYVEGMNSAQFEKDGRTIDAVVRNFIIIGEAASKMPGEVVVLRPEVPWQLMRDMRNFAVHQYWGVETGVLWQTIQLDLPPLVPLLKAIVSG